MAVVTVTVHLRNFRRWSAQHNISSAINKNCYFFFCILLACRRNRLPCIHTFPPCRGRYLSFKLIWMLCERFAAIVSSFYSFFFFRSFVSTDIEACVPSDSTCIYLSVRWSFAWAVKMCVCRVSCEHIGMYVAHVQIAYENICIRCGWNKWMQLFVSIYLKMFAPTVIWRRCALNTAAMVSEWYMLDARNTLPAAWPQHSRKWTRTEWKYSAFIIIIIENIVYDPDDANNM